MTGTLLEVRNLHLRFGAIEALAGVDLDVAEGELLAVIGPNGAGKTSLFNVLSRAYRPSSGSVRYAGRDLLDLRADELAGAGIARTFQNLGLFPSLSVLDNVLVGRDHALRSGLFSSGLRLPRARQEERESRAAALDALAFVGAVGVADRPVLSLPYGVRKRVEIARALAVRPRLLLLDEPVAGMSRSERAAVVELLGRLRNIDAGWPLTVLLVEHDMNVVMGVADQVVVLDFGRVIARGTPSQVQRDPDVMRAYLGENPPTATALPASASAAALPAPAPDAALPASASAAALPAPAPDAERS